MEDVKQTTGTKVAEEVAIADFQRFADSRRLDRKRSHMDENDARDFEGFRWTLIDAIMEGGLIIQDDGTPVQKTMCGKTITWHRPKASALVVTDRKKQTATMAKIITSMAEITRTSERDFSGLDMEDTNVSLALYSIFLA